MRWTTQTSKPYLAYVSCHHLAPFHLKTSYRRCEHYSSKSKKHFVNWAISEGLYNLEYLTALCLDDSDAIKYWETRAKERGYGLLAPCTHIRNHLSIKVNCPYAHRSPKDGTMFMTPMGNLPCSSKVTAYVPLAEYFSQCPKMLVVCRSPHTHPIPLPATTPEPLKRELQNVLQELDQDLPDLTPRRLLCHPLFRSYLKKTLPSIYHPMATDLHPSLANLDHLAAFINAAVKHQFPAGTGWQGVLSLQKAQRLTCSPDQFYLCIAEEMSWSSLEATCPLQDPTDPLPLSHKDTAFRLIICMNLQRSHDLLQTRNVQSDIAFKRVSGYKEFELVSFDEQSHSHTISLSISKLSFSIPSSYIAHKYLFDQIRLLVLGDTGQYIQYRHLHSNDLTHHRLGLHLQDIVRREIGLHARDLHQHEKRLIELTEYEHLHRLLRLCVVHIFRNIQACKVPDTVKQYMRSLPCIQHSDWNGTLERIAKEGGIAGQAWIDDKVRSKFAFQAMCQAQSHIPLEIWRAGDSSTNLSEGLHADVNREGIHCSLIGAIRRAQHYDLMRLKSQQVLHVLLHPLHLNIT
ncbi:hypothetical protein ARMGADRAFT_920768 [Armillaria gallica]|uniref:Uncharacterized protein n=1 Tax=Armillaria gallica TaxID=47427 RepID=A0A2H3DXB1_ARMGA|nr:hypothetical protein ARMGADRAFT_920768 [Armillaria gallica]